MPKAGMLLAIVTGVAVLAAGVNPWLAIGVVAIWLGSLWLSRPEPTAPPARIRSFAVSRETIAPFIEPLGIPLLLLDADRIVAANKAARETLGSHIVGQDVRVALRHPEAIELIADEKTTTVKVSGLTTPRSLWQLSRFQIDKRFRLIEFVNHTAEADISRAHTDFVANASHELRTPLASIVGFLEVLQDGEDKLDSPTRRKFLGTMDGEARRMQALVEDLMSLSRIEAEKHDAPRAEANLAQITEIAVKGISEVRRTDRLKLSLSGDPVVILGEAGQLDQLIRNLIDNAIKYGDPDTPITVTIAGGKEGAVLSVADHGPGIPREHLPHLTRRFYRTDPGRSRASGGTGLGLAIVKHIVERHRGELDIDSRPGEGTTVTARFPLANNLS